MSLPFWPAEQWFPTFSPEAFSFYIEYRSIIKNSVDGTQEGIIHVEIVPPVRRMFVAGENNVGVAFLVVPPVNEIKE